MRQFKIVVEKHLDGYVVYPLGLKGFSLGRGIHMKKCLLT